MQSTTARQASIAARTYGWRVFFDLTDHFRSLPLDQRLSHVTDPPEPTGDQRLDSLLASIVYYLCNESGLVPPQWAVSWDNWLVDPWFFTDIDRMYAYALVESPPEFRSNNIFVLGNFMERV